MNHSPEIHLVLSSNKEDRATEGKITSSTVQTRDLSLKRDLQVMWTRISDRFPNVSRAFRFFDVNFNNSISFNEF